MTDKPLVSIIIACYNSDKYIYETLDSLQNQVHTNWECIIVDDGSTDKSKEVIMPFVEKDKRYKYVYQKNQGASVARNTGIKNSSGKYILPLDSDDYISTNYTQKAIEILEKNPTVKVVYCKGMMFGDKKGEFKLAPFSFEKLIIKNMLIVASMYRREDYDKTPGYDPKMFSSEDWEFWISLLKTGGEVYKIPEFHWFYRKHKESKNKKNHHRREELRQYVCNKHPELYENLFPNPIQTYLDMEKYKKYYNKIRKLTFRKPV